MAVLPAVGLLSPVGVCREHMLTLRGGCQPLTLITLRGQVAGMTDRSYDRLPLGPDVDSVALTIRPARSRLGWVIVTVWRRMPSESRWLVACQRYLDAAEPPGDSPEWDQVLQTLYNAAAAVSEAACCPFPSATSTHDQGVLPV